MNNSELITIGTLSKITGVKVKALNYYESKGILPPVYINPENNYRYYSIAHVYVVGAIRLCVDLGIPLKEFGEFNNNDGSGINLSQLISYGNELVEKN